MNGTYNYFVGLFVVSFHLVGAEGFIPSGRVSFFYRKNSTQFNAEPMKRWINGNTNAMCISTMSRTGGGICMKFHAKDIEADVLPSYLDGLEWDPSWDETEEECDNNMATDVPQQSELKDLAHNSEGIDSDFDDYKHGLGGMSLKEISMEYGFPIDCFLDVLCRWGIEPPIHEDTKLGDLANGEQAFSLLEMMTSVDVADVQDTYVGETIGEIADELGVPLSSVFLVCARRRMNLSLGVDTRLTRAEYRILYEELGFDWDEWGDDRYDPAKRGPSSQLPFDPNKPLGHGYAAPL